jgi:hypothetical protein
VHRLFSLFVIYIDGTDHNKLTMVHVYLESKSGANRRLIMHRPTLTALEEGSCFQYQRLSFSRGPA